MPRSVDDESIRIIITLKKKIIVWVEGDHPAWVALILLSLFAAVVEIGYAGYSSFQSRSSFIGTISYALSISLASLICGIFLGFLFGIPRTLTGGGQANPSNSEVSTGSTQLVKSESLGTNTNLEQISDWLTKIMVGVGLTQIGKLGPVLRQIAHALQPGFGNADGSKAIGLLIAIFFVVSGFLIGYLWTRIHLTKAFRTAEMETLAAKVTTIEVSNAEVASALSDVQAQPKKDAAALSLAQKILDPTKGDPLISEIDLLRAFKESSTSLKVQLFYIARKFRKECKADAGKTNQIQRVIPILRALIAANPVDCYHRSHAQLAYALKEKSEPDSESAAVEISHAIRIREERNDSGYRNYELFRACRNIENMDAASGATKDAYRAQILKDLRAAAQAGVLRIEDEPVVSRWMTEQHLDLTFLQEVTAIPND